MRGQVTFEFIITIVIILGVFVAGLAIFESRQSLNVSYSNNWELQNLAYRVARNINAAYLLDGNAKISDSIFFDTRGISIEVLPSTISFSSERFFADAPISAGAVSFLVTDFNGPVVFKKINGKVVVDYQ